MRYTMKTRCLLYALLLLLTMGCGQKSDSTAKEMDGDLSARIDSIGNVFTDSASMLRIMVMDSSGRLVANSIVGNEGSITPNEEVVIEPGLLLSPMILASIMDDPDMNFDPTMRVKVGCQYYTTPYCVKDFDTCFDGVDSLPLSRAIALHSEVAMCELGNMYYSSSYDSLKARLSNMVNGFRYFPNNNMRDLGRFLVDPDREKHREVYLSRKFYLLCCGRGVTLHPQDILSFYNSLATKQSKNAETLRGLLLETAEADIAREASAYRIAGLSANVSDVSSPTRLTTSIVGFFPADNPRYTCMVIKYGSTSRGQEAATLFIKVADALMTQLHYSNSTQQK